MTSFAAALHAARAALSEAGADSPALDARLLMAEAAGLQAAALIARSGEDVPALAEERFQSHLRRRIAGEPVARILGEKEFWGFPFRLHPATLVPRPETETLVEAVLAQARRLFPPNVSICDLGVGTGAILIALLLELPEARGIGTDISEAAIETARLNAERLGVAGRINFYCGDFAAGPEGRFDVVVSNPPYVRSGDIAGLRREVRDFDPSAALDGGTDGLAAYRVILGRADALLRPGGLLAFEVGRDQSDVVAALCRAHGLSDVAVGCDLAGAGRIVSGFMPMSAYKDAPQKKALGNFEVSS